MRLLLDTVVLIHAVQAPERLSLRVDAALRSPKNSLDLSAISLTEIAMKSAQGKLRLSAEVAREAVESLAFAYSPTPRNMPSVCSNCRFIIAIHSTGKSLPKHCSRISR